MMIEHTIHVQDQHLHYTMEEKPIKNVNLRIRPDGSVYVSAPFGTSRTLIDDFVVSKSKQILAIQQAQSAMAPTPRTYADGEVIHLLGRSVTLRAVQGTRDEAVWQDDTLLLRLRHPADSAARKRLTESFIGSQCQSVFSAALDAAYPPFAHLGAAKPALRIRDMKSRWGSCMPQKGVITLNRRLIQAPPACIRMVVTHELCHLIYPNHGSGFYALLSRLTPDWPQCRLVLKQNAAQWLR